MMKMSLAQALEMIARGETPEQYEKRVIRLRRLYNERYCLEDGIKIFEESAPEDPRLVKKRKRLEKVLQEIEQLR